MLLDDWMFIWLFERCRCRCCSRELWGFWPSYLKWKYATSVKSVGFKVVRPIVCLSVVLFQLGPFFLDLSKINQKVFALFSGRDIYTMKMPARSCCGLSLNYARLAIKIKKVKGNLTEFLKRVRSHCPGTATLLVARSFYFYGTSSSMERYTALWENQRYSTWKPIHLQ